MGYSKFSTSNQITIFEGSWYGASGYESESQDLTRIGSDMTLHASLPVQSNMRGCLLLDNGTVNYYLNATDWTKKADNSVSNLTGADGQVMIEIPEHWYFDFMDDSVMRRAIRTTSKEGWIHVHKSYIAAYEAVLHRPTSKLSSVVNNSVDYRGGAYQTPYPENDALPTTQLQKAISQLPIGGNPSTPTISLRDFAKNRGVIWTAKTWKLNHVIQRLFTIEFATKNSQKPVNNIVTAEGYRQGGLGIGATTVSGVMLNSFNNYAPFIPVGVSDSLANGTGEITYTVPFSTPEDVKVCRYRGIENVFGHLMEMLDGIIVYQNRSNDKFEFYLIDDIAYFNSSDTSHARLAGVIGKHNNEVISGMSVGDMIITSVYGSDFTKYYCDAVKAGSFNETSDYNHYRTGGYNNNDVASDSSGLFWSKYEDHYYMAFKYGSSRLNCFPNGY